MPSRNANSRSSDERTASLTALAAYAEDFRAAVVEEIALGGVTALRSRRVRRRTRWP
jgi:hypothetical protein